METKEFKVHIPEGYEIDRENSTFECIKFKYLNRNITYNDICNTLFADKDGFFITTNGNITADSRGTTPGSERSSNTATVTVTGYADRGTGTAAFNDRIAARRADVVEAELVNRGIARDRIVKSSKGSRVQPFNDNDMNRVTICIAED